MNQTIRMTEADFFSGIFAALSLRNYKTLTFNKRFEKTIAKAFQELMDSAEQRKIDLRFRIRLHPFHGDSETIRKGISSAAQRGIISLDSPGGKTIRIKLAKDDANAMLENMAGGNLFVYLADRIIEIFSYENL